MCSQTRNSCAKASDNRSRSKNLKPKKSRGVNLTPPLPLKASRVKVQPYIHEYAWWCVRGISFLKALFPFCFFFNSTAYGNKNKLRMNWGWNRQIIGEIIWFLWNKREAHDCKTFLQTKNLSSYRPWLLQFSKMNKIQVLVLPCPGYQTRR